MLLVWIAVSAGHWGETMVELVVCSAWLFASLPVSGVAAWVVCVPISLGITSRDTLALRHGSQSAQTGLRIRDAHCACFKFRVAIWEQLWVYSFRALPWGEPHLPHEVSVVQRRAVPLFAVLLVVCFLSAAPPFFLFEVAELPRSGNRGELYNVVTAHGLRRGRYALESTQDSQCRGKARQKGS